MATHSTVLAWRIPGTEETGGLPSMGLHRGGHDWSDLAAAAAAGVGECIGSYRRRQWHPTPLLLPGKAHGRRSLVGCSPWGLWESDMTEWLQFHFSLSWVGEGNGNPLQCSCLENPRDGGAWWAAVYGVAHSRTRLKLLSRMLMIMFWTWCLSAFFFCFQTAMDENFCIGFPKDPSGFILCIKLIVNHTYPFIVFLQYVYWPWARDI